ncbi:MAG: hypothetical protein QM773_14335 [Hyphomonadaceae bacterium]
MKTGYLLYGDDGIYWDRIFILVALAGFVFLCVVLYQAFIATPAVRRAESARLSRKSLPEIVYFLGRGGDGKLPANRAVLMELLSSYQLPVTTQQLDGIAATFGYSEPLFLNELAKRATLMTRRDKHDLVRAAVLVSVTSAFPDALESARRIVKALGALQRRTATMARRAFTAGPAALLELAAA